MFSFTHLPHWSFVCAHLRPRYRVLIYHKSPQLVDIASWCMADYEVSCYKFRRVGHTHTINAFIGGDVITTIEQLLWFAFDHSAKRQYNQPKRIVFKTICICVHLFLVCVASECRCLVWHDVCRVLAFVDSSRSSWVSLWLWPLYEYNEASVKVVMNSYILTFWKS